MRLLKFLKEEFSLYKEAFFYKKHSSFIENYNFIYHGNSCSELLAKLIFELKKIFNKNLNVYLPAYFCGQSLKYLRALNINLFFYDLTEDLLPDFKELDKSYLINKIDVLIIVHYFGRKISYKELSLFLKNKAGIYLIEDCAHLESPRVSSNWLGTLDFFTS